MAEGKAPVAPPNRPAIGLGIGVTGHRLAHAGYRRNQARIETTIRTIFEAIDRLSDKARERLDGFGQSPTRLTTLMTDGTDQAAAGMALERGWQLISPLPFGRRLNLAINALPGSAEDAEALLEGRQAGDASVQQRAQRIEQLTSRAAVFDLADEDESIARLYLDKLRAPGDFAAAQDFALQAARRAALAGRIVISQSDLLIGVWDGVSTAHPGGTGHTIARALDMGEAVIWIDPAEPEQWRFLQSPEALANLSAEKGGEDRARTLRTLVEGVFLPDAPLRDPSHARRGLAALYDAEWRDRSAVATHAYRKIEAIFGGEARPWHSVTQIYERPDALAQGSAAPLLAAARDLPGADRDQIGRIERRALRNFAWADGLSARLSDRYRGGMVVNFLLSSFAIVGGIAYLPLVDPAFKWPFALFEFVLLLGIVAITWSGIRYRWHGRWFETRRVAEYFRHSPFLLLLGIGHAPGRTPKGADTSWPEWIFRHTMREIGLPGTTITPAYLNSYLALLLDCHVRPQREYHRAKVRRLKAVHHNLDRLSEWLFKLAIISVASYLLLKLGAYWQWIDPAVPTSLSKTFTVLGVMFPTFGGAIAGIRFFGDFERFAAISEVTFQRLDGLSSRIERLQQAPLEAINYGRVKELALATEDVVVSEIENWQAVFRGKEITVPV